MSLLQPEYYLIWRDAEDAQACTSFRAVDDDAAAHIAAQAAAVSLAELVHFFKVSEVLQVETHAAVAGSNVRSKAWAFYETGKGKALKLSIPAFDTSRLVTETRRFSTDLLGGVGRLVSRAGQTATKFVTGRWNYGLRANDEA